MDSEDLSSEDRYKLDAFTYPTNIYIYISKLELREYVAKNHLTR